MAEDKKINEKKQRLLALLREMFQLVQPDLDFGLYRTKPGDDRHRQSVLVLWRTLTDAPEQDAAALEAFFSQQMKFDPTRREDKTLYDIIYINGTHNLPHLGKYGEVRLLEERFHRRMCAGEEN